MRGIDLIWVLLLMLTLANMVIAEQAQPSFFFVVIISISIAWKGQMVINRFMELRNANPLIKMAMSAYFYVIPGLIIIVHAFPEFIADQTRLE